MLERLWTNGPVLEQAEDVFPLGADSMLLADFVRPGPRDRILDLGAGSGVLPVVIAWDRPAVTGLALEASHAAARLAARNLCRNGLADRITLLEADLREHRRWIPPGAFDLIVSNPPYFSPDSGRVAAGPMGAARSGLWCSLPELCAAAGWGCRYGGRFCLVFRPERLCDLIGALRDHGLEPKRLRPVHHTPGMPVSLLLLEARRGGRPGLVWEPDLYQYTADGQESPDLRRACHRETEEL